jgi:predicted lipoprotein with Yx(FWY)xxD motif
MRTPLKFLLPTLVASLTLAACGSSSKSPSSATTAAPSSKSSSAGTSSEAGTVKTASNAKLGATILTDAHGMTIYSLSGEQGGKFICTSSACLQVWHPVISAGASASSGSIGSLAAVKRPDGTEQLAYKGMPLYTFTGDQAPGEAKGQGIKDVGTWNAVTVGARSTTTTSSAPATEKAPAKSGGGYAY